MTDKTTAAQFPSMDNVKKLVEDQSHRMSQLFDEAGKAHTKWIEYGNTQIDEVSELMKTQFNYVNELAVSWRKLSMDSMKKTMESFNG
jgi:hypothetical protein